MTLSPMARQDEPPLLTQSGAVREAQWDRVGNITSSDRCRRPVGRKKNHHVSFSGHAPYGAYYGAYHMALAPYGAKHGAPHMVRVPKMRRGGFAFFSLPTGLLQPSDDVMLPTRSHCASRTAPDCVSRGGTS